MPGLVTAITALGASFGGAAAGGFFSTVAGRLLASVALSALSQALAPKPRAPGIRNTITQTGGTNPAGFIVGYYATAGTAICPPLSQGDAGKTPNAYLTYVIALSDIPGVTLAGLIVDGEAVTIGAGTHADYGQEIEGVFQDRMWIRYHDGTQTTADAMLLDKFGSDPDRPWSADMIGEGMAYAVVTCRYDREVFSAFPEVRFVLDGIPMYDPRLDSTVGGSGPQRWGARETWAQTDNPAVMIYNILRGVTIGLKGSGLIWGGRAQADDLPLANWFAAMNKCDEPVAVAGGGTEPRFRAGYEVAVADEPAEVIEQLLKSCNGQIVDLGGIWKIRCGGPGLPVLFVTDADTLVTRGQDFDPFPGIDATYNAITATYPDPASLWEPKEAPPRYNATWEAEDGDRRLPVSVDLPACPYGKQVQRLTRAYIRDHRRLRRHNIPLGPAASAVEPLDVIAWTSDWNGYVTKSFEVTAASVDLRTCINQMALREVDATDYDWSADDELPSVPSPATITRPAPQSVPGFGVAPASVLDADGVSRRPAIAVTWTADGLDDVRSIRFQVRRAVSATAELRPFTRDIDDGQHLIAEGILPATNYYVRGRLIVDGRKTLWTAWVFVTTPAVYIGNRDFEGGIRATMRALGMAPPKFGPTLPAADPSNDLFLNTTDGKLYRWVGGSWQASVPTADLTGTLDIARFAAAIRPVEVVNSLPVSGNFDGRQAYLTTDKKLYRHNGTAWVKTVDGGDIIAGTITAGAIAAGAIGADQMAANAVVAKSVAVGDFTNLVRNGDFGDGTSPVTDYFAAPPNGTVGYLERSANALWSLTNARSLVLTKPGTMSAQVNVLQVGTFEVTNGEVIWVDTAIKGVGGASANGAYLRIEWIDAAGTYTFGDHVNVVNNAPITGAWVAYSQQVTVPAHAVRARVRLISDSSNTTAPNLLFDRIILRRANRGELTVDGSITAAKIAAGTITGDKVVAGTITGALLAASGIITDTLQIGNLVISTENIANNAISIGVDSYTSGSIASQDVGGIEPHQRVIQTAVITRAAKKVVAQIAFDLSGASSTIFALQLERTIGGVTTVVRKVFLRGYGISEAVLHHNLTLVDTSTVTGVATYGVRILATSVFTAYARALTVEQRLK